jgi:hypothetical protein
MTRVSYSQYSLWSQCPKQYKLQYIDKLGVYSGNIHTLFGTSVHETIQHYLDVMYNDSKKAADLLNLDLFLLNRMRANFILESGKLEGDIIPATQLQMEEFYGDGRRGIAWFKKNLSKFFMNSGWSLIGIEVPLNIEVKSGVTFVGFIDIVVKNDRGEYLIIDLKTSTSGWNKYDKQDPIKNSQLLLYKQFYSQKFDVPIDSIKVEYHIFKRKLIEDAPFPVPYVSKHIPANGKPSVNRVVSEFMNFVDTVFDENGERRLDIKYRKIPGKGGKNCKWCEFKERGLCDGVAD